MIADRDRATTCPDCGADVFRAVDSATSEHVLVDRWPTVGGRVELQRLPLVRLGLIAVDHLTRPAPRQPAHELHSRTCPDPPPPAAVDLSDDPGLEQSRGWRQ